MGLDISFHLPRGAHDDDDDDDDDARTILSLRDHGAFFDLVVKHVDGRVDDVYDDVFIGFDALEEIEDILIAQMNRFELSEDLIPEQFEAALDLLRSQHVPDEHWKALLPAYVRILDKLILHAEEHGPLICAYSV